MTWSQLLCSTTVPGSVLWMLLGELREPALLTCVSAVCLHMMRVADVTRLDLIRLI